MPSNIKSDPDLPQIANTTVLRFGESHLMCVSHTSHRSCDRDTTIASLVPSPSFSRVGRRARGRKKKGLVHTVCACVKKFWNSETSWHGQDIFGYFGHN